MNEIIWSTASEINNHYFTLEFSADAIEWEYLTTVTWANNSNTLIHYPTIEHFSPYNQTYYRLRQTDFNGETKTYNPIMVVRGAGVNELAVYPNPASSVLNIENNGNLYSRYEIADETGRMVLQVLNPAQKITVDISVLKPGLYFISSYSNDEMKTTKFIKN